MAKPAPSALASDQTAPAVLRPYPAYAIVADSAGHLGGLRRCQSYKRPAAPTRSDGCLYSPSPDPVPPPLDVGVAFAPSGGARVLSVGTATAKSEGAPRRN